MSHLSFQVRLPVPVLLQVWRHGASSEQTAKENGIPFKAIHIESKEQAQNAPTPITTYALFCDGEYISNEQMNDTKFLKLVSK